MTTFRIGVDIGGTFTDIVFLGSDGTGCERHSPQSFLPFFPCTQHTGRQPTAQEADALEGCACSLPALRPDPAGL